ncbi:MAG: hypothetical protein HY287_02390 [Planctomycetes bacterium]|nr:hypothetical protein [Planctomycetota bacterium]MBI3833158.1 hypothetical protein [Planctomycetota bacterium]
MIRVPRLIFVISSLSHLSGCGLLGAPGSNDSASVRLERDSGSLDIDLGIGRSRFDVNSDFDGLGFPGFRVTARCQYEVFVLFPPGVAHNQSFGLENFPGLVVISQPNMLGTVESNIYCGAQLQAVCEGADPGYVRVDDPLGAIHYTVNNNRVTAEFDITLRGFRATGSVDLPADFLLDEEKCLTIAPSP